jgi:tetratricopeptide (TPR) repeat protein
MKLNIFSKVSIAAALAAALTPALRADNSLQCTITSDDGQPAAKLEFILKNAELNKEWKKKSNDKGEVEFKGLKDGKYTLDGVMDNYLLTKAKNLEISGNKVNTCAPVFVSIGKLNTLLNAANSLMISGKNDEAIAKADELLAIAPSLPNPMVIKAVALANKGDMDNAMKNIEAAAALDEAQKPKIELVHIQALGAQASQALQKRDFDTAIARYQEIAKMKPGEATTYYNLSLAYGHKGDLNTALVQVEKAIALKPDDAEFAAHKKALEGMLDKQLNQELKLGK